MRVLRRRCIVLALIKKCSRLLPFQRIVVKRRPIHADVRRTLLPPQQRRSQRRQLLQFANPCFHSFDNSRRLQLLFQCVNDRRARRSRVHRLRQNLHRHHIVIAIHNQPRQKISFAENDAVSVRIRNQILPVSNSGPNALRDQSRQVRYRPVRDHADRDL